MLPSWSWLAGPSFQLHPCPWEPKLWLHRRSWLHQRKWPSARDLRLSCPRLLPLSSSLLTIHECPLKPTSSTPHPHGLLQGPPPCITPPSPRITQPSPCITPPSPHITQPSPCITPPSPHITQPSPCIMPPSPHITQPSPCITPPSPHNTQPSPCITPPSPHVTQPSPCIMPPSPHITPPPPCITPPPPLLLFLEHLLISTSKSLLSHHLSDAGPHTPVFSPWWELLEGRDHISHVVIF